MDEFSLAALRSLILANQLLSVGIISFLLAAVTIYALWEKVGYFLMRVWHGVPLIGTVSRLARDSDAKVGDDTWINHEETLAKAYYPRYKKFNKNADSYRAALDYLAKVGESGRRARPYWVLLLTVVLVLVEAVGFGFVLSGWMSLDASTNDRHIMTVCTALLLAVASTFLAEAAGHALHHNSLVSKARHWWQGEDTSKRSRQLKSPKPINLEDSFNDNDAPDYEQMLARVKDVNAKVEPKYTAMICCAVFVLAMAVGAFVVRAKTLDSIETETVNSMRADASAQTDNGAGSPFELPESSQAVNNGAEEQTIQDKMDAIRGASLTTYVILSAIYLAIQGITLWLASIFHFAGVHSRGAWELTHKYKTAEEMMDDMDQNRTAIAGHADHKLRKLQALLAERSTTDSSVLDALAGELSSKRDFKNYALYKADQTHAPTSKPAVKTPAAAAVVAAPAVVEPVAVAVTPAPAAEPAPAPAATAAVASAPKASEFDDLRETSDEDLDLLSDEYGLSAEQLKRIKATQLALAKTGKYPVGAPA